MGQTAILPSVSHRGSRSVTAFFEPALVAGAAPLLLFQPKMAPLAAGALGLFWMARLVVTGHLSRPTSLDRPLLGLALMGIVGTAVSADRTLSFPKLWSLFFALAVYVAIVNWPEPQEIVWLATWLFPVVAIAVAGLGLIGSAWQTSKGLVGASIYAHLPSFASRVPESVLAGLTQPHGWQPNEIAGTLDLVVPTVIGICLWQGKTVARFAGISAILGIGVLLLTQSRSGYVGLAVALLVLVVARWRGKSWWAFGAVLVVSLLLGLAGQYLGPHWAALVAHQKMGIASDWQSRRELWGRSWEMIQDFPFTGIGLNTFPLVLSVLYPPFETGSATYVPHAHNLFIQTAVDFGLPGLGAFLGLLWGAGRCLIATTRQSNPATRGLAAGIGASILAYLVFGLTDAVTLGSRPTFILFGTLAVLVVTGWLDVPKSPCAECA